MLDYIECSRRIRALSMPLEEKGQAYGQLEANFLRIRQLFAQNRTYLKEQVFAPLMNGADALSAEKAQELMELSDRLADTETLEMADVRLAFYIVEALEPYYARIGDKAKYIHCLFR